jgi:hypothetical protein
MRSTRVTFWGGVWEGFTLPAQRNQPRWLRVTVALADVAAFVVTWLFATYVLR